MTISDTSSRPETADEDGTAVEPTADLTSVAEPTRSAARAYERRRRRQDRMKGQRLTRTGSPIHAALSRVPFVLLIMLMLAGGIVGVLFLNTLTDEVGLQADKSTQAQIALNLKIEEDRRAVADQNATPQIDKAAKALGMVPAGDPPLLIVAPNGSTTIVGTPTPAEAPVVAAAPTVPAVATTTPKPTPPKPTTAATTVVGPTAAAPSGPGAGGVIAPKSTAKSVPTRATSPVTKVTPSAPRTTATRSTSTGGSTVSTTTATNGTGR